MKKVLKSGFLLLIISALSKAAALLITIVFSRIYGASPLTDAYYAASSVPNLINNSLTVCSLSIFVPLYIEVEANQGKKFADSFGSKTLNLYFFFNLVLTIIVCCLSSFFARLVAPGFDAENLNNTTRFICLLSLSFSITISTQVLINISNANHKHLAQAVFTFLNHITTIVLLLFVGERTGIFSYPIICLISWIINLFLQYIYTRKFFNHEFVVFKKDIYFRKMILLSVPVIIATAAEQINLTIDSVLASTLEEGSVTFLSYSHRIFTAVLGLFGTVILTIYYPLISKKYKTNPKSANSDIRTCIDIITILVIPISVFLCLISKEIIKLLYGGGSIDSNGINSISWLFFIYTLSLYFASFKELVTKLYYVVGNTIIPMVINVVGVVFNIVLSIIFKSIFGLFGIAIATSISVLFTLIVEIIFIKKYQNIMSIEVFNYKHFIKVVLSSLLACFIIIVLNERIIGIGFSSLVNITIFSIIYFALYVIFLCFFKNEYIYDFFIKTKGTKK